MAILSTLYNPKVYEALGSIEKVSLTVEAHDIEGLGDIILKYVL